MKYLVCLEAFLTLLVAGPAFVVGALVGMAVTGYKNGRLAWEEWKRSIDDRLDR